MRVLITGGASGLGYALVKMHLDRGDHVTVIDLQPKPTDLHGDPSKLDWFINDVCDVDFYEDILNQITNEKHFFYRLYLCAGIAYFGKISEISHESIEKVVSVNLISRIRQTKVAVEIAKRSKKKFQIILISSSTGLMPMAQFSVYSATTSGLLNFSRACQSERDSKDVKIVSAVMDGMDTNFQLKAGIDKVAQDLLNPDVVAKQLINLGESFSGAIYIGRKIQIIRIMNRILPVEWIDWLLSHASRRRFS